MPRLLAALLALALIASPAVATAQSPTTNAPPGNSAVDEYLETVPSATGNSRPRTPSAGGTSSGGLPPAQRAQLEKRGPDGKALADAIDATSSPQASTGTPHSGSVSAAEGRSPIAQVFDVAAGRDGGDGMGVLLPAILLASLLGFIALVVMRRRSAS